MSWSSFIQTIVMYSTQDCLEEYREVSLVQNIAAHIALCKPQVAHVSPLLQKLNFGATLFEGPPLPCYIYPSTNSGKGRHVTRPAY